MPISIDPEKLEKWIYEVLIQHTENCKIHKALSRAFKPFLLIDPETKAKDITEELKRRAE